MSPVSRITLALLAGLAAAGGPSLARGALVEGLYESVVAGDSTESGRAAAATDALRQVVVRVTGRGSAANDPALASLYADARRLVHTFRSTAPGQIAVSFDAAALDLSLQQAGQRIWSRERPVTLVVLASGRSGASHDLAGSSEPELRRDLLQAAQARGLPLAWPAGLPTADEEARYQDALAGRLEPLRELARQLGADGVLLGRVTPAGTAWSWLGPAGEGSASGAAAEALQALADRLGSQFAAAGAASGQIVALVRGVRDLPGYAAASAALASLPNVHSVALEEVSGETLRFRLGFDGDPDTLRRALRDAGRLLPDDDAGPGGAMQLVLKP